MLDRATFWSSPRAIDLQGDGIALRCLPAVPQIMASGDPARIHEEFGLPHAVGLLGRTTGDTYALRLARNRMLIVGQDRPHAELGWHNGIAMTTATGALAVFEISGPRAMELVARGTAIDSRIQSPCAALTFAGVTGTLYRHDDRLRIHIDRGLSTYLTDWAWATTLFR